jgi:hypothetical protein
MFKWLKEFFFGKSVEINVKIEEKAPVAKTTVETTFPVVEEPAPVFETTSQTTFPVVVETLAPVEEAPKPKKKRYYKPRPKKPTDGLQASPEQAKPATPTTRNRRGPESR